MFLTEFSEQPLSLLAEALPGLFAGVSEFDLSNCFPLATEGDYRIIAVPEELGQGQMHDSSENEARAFYPRPELLDIVQPVLLRAGQVAVNPRIRKMRSFSLRIKTFLLFSCECS